MKRIILFILIIIVIFFIFYYPLVVFGGRITLKSNVPIHPEDLLLKVGPLFLTLFPREDVKIIRSPFSLTLEYEEQPLAFVKFRDGIFVITKSGYLIRTEQKQVNLLANFESKFYNDFVKEFVIFVLKNGESEFIKSVELFGNGVAFVDKNGIFVIIGKGDYNIKMEEYKKSVVILQNKIKKVKTIDLRFSCEGVISWRENG
uniref:Cell division protein FtsQ n=1 Tax=Caldisericum exile TaxID=693075 RepID=A0A7C4TVB7_9BACT